MVNKRRSTRAAILSRLRASQGRVSGAELCDELGVSRVAVWKQMEALKEAGYGIETDKRGYLLARDGDFLYPWEFPEEEDRILHFGQVDSTMEKAIGLALAEDDREWIVVAESQKKGRGRRGRSWKSEPGGIFCTLVLRTGLPAQDFMKPLLAAGAALCRAVRDLSGAEAWLEWPNDLFLDGKKIAGLLPEFLASGETLRFLDLGLGLNVSNNAPDGSGANLNALTGKRFKRRDVLAAFLKSFEAERKAGFGRKGLAAQWWALSSSGGREARGEDGTRLGQAVGVAEDGSLLVERARGVVESYGLGKASLRDKEGKNERRR